MRKVIIAAVAALALVLGPAGPAFGQLCYTCADWCSIHHTNHVH